MKKITVLVCMVVSMVALLAGCYSQVPPASSIRTTPPHPKNYSAPIGNNPSANGITNSISHGAASTEDHS